MACCACGLRQRPRTPYCAQCGCPLGALAPPPSLDRREEKQQLLPAQEPVSRFSGGQAALLGFLCASLGWLPLYVGVLACILAVLLGSLALQGTRQRGCRTGAPYVRALAWAAVILGGACAIPALCGL